MSYHGLGKGGTQMMNQSLFGYTNIMNQALNASWLRNELISENIANNDTPGYKRKDVAFESFLQTALQTEQPKEMLIEQIEPQIYVDNQHMKLRLDGNNVNVETEMVEMKKNAIRYEVLADSVRFNFNRLRTVIKR